jgi:hypothetical protein
MLKRVLSSSVKSAATIISYIIVPIVKLQDIFLNDELEETSENICTSSTLESLHDPKELRELQKRVRRQLYLHGEFIKNSRK